MSNPEPPDEAARYANHFAIGYNLHEIVMDFGQSYAGDPTVRLHTRLVTAPAYARDFSEMLRGVLDDYERSFGPIGAGAANDSQ
jgi:hypothetical protein